MDADPLLVTFRSQRSRPPLKAACSSSLLRLLPLRGGPANQKAPTSHRFSQCEAIVETLIMVDVRQV